MTGPADSDAALVRGALASAHPVSAEDHDAVDGADAALDRLAAAADRADAWERRYRRLEGADWVGRAERAEATVARLRAAIDDALGRRQVTHIHAGLRAVLAQDAEATG